jgi:NADPH:quinone reductase-like Zn-dependent oxidoreductase
MKAAVLEKLGEAPRYAEFADPVAGAEEALVRVRAASLKNVERQQAAGTHYASPREFPVVCGMDGVGLLEDGTRVFFGGARKPFGAMAELTVAPRAFCFPLADSLDDLTAAALPNPGVSAWLTLTHGAKIAAGETALILGATGVTGQLAVQIAKLHGAKRVVAAGRNESALAKLNTMGADETIQIAQSDEALKIEFARAAGDDGFDVIIDYLWGHPTEVLIAAITKSEFAPVTKQTRLVQVGESAGPTISLPAAVLRSTALTIMGTAGIPPIQVLMDAMQQVMQRGASGELRIETERVPLAEVEQAWSRKESSGRRIVLVP